MVEDAKVREDWGDSVDQLKKKTAGRRWRKQSKIEKRKYEYGGQ
jgi:hypothetical protein